MTSALVPSTVDPDTRASLVIYERLKPLKDALGLGNLTDGEIQLFAMVALHTGLDPFTKQIYAIKRGGKVTHQTGIDGYRSTAERTNQYRNSDEATYEPCDCGSDDSPADHPKVARVVVYRAYPDGVRGQVGVARWHELKPDHRKPQNAYDFLDQMWWDMPYNQLAKCAEANGLRKAFPRVLGGVYIAEEMQAGEIVDGSATEVPPKPTPSTIEDRVAARRAQAEAAAAPADAEEGAFRMTPIEQAPQSAPEPTVAPIPTDVPDARPGGLCGSVSPIDAATCGIAADVRHTVCRELKDGETLQTWPKP